MGDIHRITEENTVFDKARNATAAPPAEETISIRLLRLDELETAFSLTRAHPELSVADDAVVRNVLTLNSHSFWGVYRMCGGAEQSATLAGYYGFLLLNESGHAALLDRTLDPRQPPLEFLAKEGERPSGVYIWSMVVQGLSAIATPMVTKALGQTCAGRPLYAGAGTQGGLNLMRRQGFTPVTPKDDDIGGLFLFGKLGDLKVRPLRAQHLVSRFKTVVVSTPDEMEKVRAIRTVFMLEQNCPFEEEFDGNDFSATHILGTVDGEPAATMRLRYFADFVKLERLAVLPRFRRTLIAKEVVDTAVNVCRRKGYTKVYGHAQKRLVNFWARFGFKPIDKNYALVFSDHEYVELWGELEPHSNPITMYSDPHLFLRQEGRWDEPGILEKSSARPPTNPH
jgi:predicted GNAT family N-acyltransferase